MARIDGRAADQLRPVEIIPNINQFAEGSCLIRCGNTHVLCCASVEEAVCQAASKLRGAFSLLVMSPQKLIACRDPWGFRPLCMGRKGQAILFASESCAIEAVGGRVERELEPGEVVVVQDGRVQSIRDNCRGKSHMCIFEYIYFARPDSIVFGEDVYQCRKHMGYEMAKEAPTDAELVMPFPDSGV